MIRPVAVASRATSPRVAPRASCRRSRRRVTWPASDRGIRFPRVVAAESAHAAFTKAADYFDVELIRVPVGPDFRVDVDAMADACTDTTIMVVGSAPTYPQGVVDPITDIAALASERGILCHVDACMGGFLLPFLTQLGRFTEPFDFRVPGVTSISADVHKYGYASKGVSVILYRTHDLARHQVFATADWLGGFYASTAMAGTRPAGPIAAAWAALMHIGIDGYLELTRTAHDAALALRAGIESIDGLGVRGDPPATVIAFGAQDPASLDIFAVGERLHAEGWYLDRQHRPDSLHATVHAGSAGHRPVPHRRPTACRQGGGDGEDGETGPPPTGRAPEPSPAPS